MNKRRIVPHHVGISVSDLTDAIKWYEEMLGFSLTDRVYVDHINCEIAMMENGNFQLELFGHRNTKPLPDDRRHPDDDMVTQGTKHLCLQVCGLDEFVNELREKGVRIISGPGTFGPNRFYYICDNSGVLIELNEPVSEAK